MTALARRVRDVFSLGVTYNPGTGRLAAVNYIALPTLQHIPYASIITPNAYAGEVVIVGELTGHLTVESVPVPVPGQCLELHFTQGSEPRLVQFSSEFEQPTGLTPLTAGARWMVRFRCVSSSGLKWALDSTARYDSGFQLLLGSWPGAVANEAVGSKTPRLVNRSNATWVLRRFFIDCDLTPSPDLVIQARINGLTPTYTFTLLSGLTSTSSTPSTPLTVAPGHYIQAWLTARSGAEHVNFSVQGYAA